MKSCTTAKLVITFGITVAKLFVLLLTNNNAKLLQRVKSGFKRTANWNKYQSKATVQTIFRLLN